MSFYPNNAIVIPSHFGGYMKGTAQMDKNKKSMPEIGEEEYEEIRRVPLEEAANEEEAAAFGAPRSRKRGSCGKDGSRTDRERRLEEMYRREERPHLEAGERRSRRKGSPREKSRGRSGMPPAAVFLALMLGIGAGLSGGYYMWGYEKPYMVDLKAVEVPSWVEQDFIRKIYFPVRM